MQQCNWTWTGSRYAGLLIWTHTLMQTWTVTESQGLRHVSQRYAHVLLVSVTDVDMDHTGSHSSLDNNSIAQHTFIAMTKYSLLRRNLRSRRSGIWEARSGKWEPGNSSKSDGISNRPVLITIIVNRWELACTAV
jgi:hypothetical protein